MVCAMDTNCDKCVDYPVDGAMCCATTHSCLSPIIQSLMGGRSDKGGGLLLVVPLAHLY